MAYALPSIRAAQMEWNRNVHNQRLLFGDVVGVVRIEPESVGHQNGLAWQHSGFAQAARSHFTRERRARLLSKQADGIGSVCITIESVWHAKILWTIHPFRPSFHFAFASIFERANPIHTRRVGTSNNLNSVTVEYLAPVCSLETPCTWWEIDRASLSLLLHPRLIVCR